LPVSLFGVPTVPPPRIEPTAAEKFFGLAARPFSLTPDLRFAYHSRSHTHALEQVTSALRRREGLIVVTGPIGTGKTMLCRSMLDNFESRTFLSVILDPGLEVEDLLRQVLTDFGIMSGIDAPASGPLSEVTRHQFVSTLQQFLASLIPLHAHAVIMIDEAQRLNPRVLEEIRLLSNFETDEAKLLQIVLVGQPDLDDVLRRPDMRQLNQRVARRCELYPLSESEVGDYIERRLTVAASPEALGGNADGSGTSRSGLVRFSPEAVRLVAQISQGIPRVVNTLCDRVLEAAYERQLRVIDPEAVRTAGERLQLDVPGTVALPGGRRMPWMRVAAVAAVVLALGSWWMATRDSAPAPAERTVTGSAPPTQQSGSSTGAATSPSTPSSSAPSASAQSSDPPSSSVAASSPSTDSIGASTPSAGVTSSSSNDSIAAGDRFQIAVAAFRTEGRAAEVVDALKALQVPASVRPDATGTWQRVIAGPFASRDAAVAAQDALTRAGYSGTQIGAAQ
jgi:general secretion pathway protein A